MVQDLMHNNAPQHNAALSSGDLHIKYAATQEMHRETSSNFLGGFANIITGVDIFLLFAVGVFGVIWSYRKDLDKSDYTNYSNCFWTCLGCEIWLLVHMAIRFFVGYRDLILPLEFVLGLLALILFWIWWASVFTESDSLDDIKTKLRGYAYTISVVSLIMIAVGIFHLFKR